MGMGKNMINLLRKTRIYGVRGGKKGGGGKNIDYFDNIHPCLFFLFLPIKKIFLKKITVC